MLAWYVLVHPYFLYFRMIFVKKLFVFINFEQILILVFSLLTLNSNCLLSSIYKFFHDGGRYHIETSPLIYRANQWTGIYMITVSLMKELIYVNLRLKSKILSCE